MRIARHMTRGPLSPRIATSLTDPAFSADRLGDVLPSTLGSHGAAVSATGLAIAARQRAIARRLDVNCCECPRSRVKGG